MIRIEAKIISHSPKEASRAGHKEEDVVRVAERSDPLLLLERRLGQSYHLEWGRVCEWGQGFICRGGEIMGGGSYTVLLNGKNSGGGGGVKVSQGDITGGPLYKTLG